MCWGSDRKRPTAVSAKSITLNGEQMAPCRAEMASSSEVVDRCTAVHQVLRDLAMNTPVDHSWTKGR